MRILWTVNTLMPQIAKELGITSTHAISWIDAMGNRLKENQDVSLAIACIGKVDTIVSKEIDGIHYYVIPRAGIKKDMWGGVLDEFQPDVIHAYGTEAKHNYLLLKKHADIPTVVSLQGILTEYARHYYAGIDFTTMLRYTKLKDFLFPIGFFSGRKAFEKTAKVEKMILERARFVEGRSTWDKVSALKMNPNLGYFYCPRLIRAPFYEAHWSINKVERHSIFVHQGDYPIKGLHIMFEALAQVKKEFPDVKLYIAGRKFFETKTLKQKLFRKGYIDYLEHLVKKYDISNEIVFTGFLNAESLAKQLESMNVVVISSSIENAPNSLAEAEIVGTPCVASFVGGNMDMLRHEEEGFLYNYNEPNMLAEYIKLIFRSDDLANKFSKAASETARKRHDPATLEKTLLGIYKDVIASY